MAKAGDRVLISTKDELIEGILLPEEKGFTIIKLDSGYNIGIDPKRIKEVNAVGAHKEKKGELKKAKKEKGLPTISILHTGGTIAGKVDYETGGVVSRFTPEEILQMFPELHEIANIESRLVRNMASDDMRFAHYNILAEAVEEEVKKGAYGVIITHGTDTLHHTGAALSFALQSLPIPVILVGSQRSSDRGSTDAALNLLSAAMFIAKTDFAGVGVCMHEGIDDTNCIILRGTKCRKMHSTRRDAFRPINALPFARVNFNEGKIIFFSPDYPKRSKSMLEIKKFRPDLKTGIVFIHPNMYAEQIEAYAGWNGIVLAGTGLGHAPISTTDKETEEHIRIFEAIKNLIEKGTIVAMSTQTINGQVDMNVYAPGRKLIESGVIGNLTNMHPETAFIKLAWLLSNHKKEEIPELYQKNIAGEISERLEKSSFLWKE